jgi:hypothetical protein
MSFLGFLFLMGVGVLLAWALGRFAFPDDDGQGPMGPR